MWIAVFKHKLVDAPRQARQSACWLRLSPRETCCRRVAQQDLRRMEELFAELVEVRDQPSLLNAGLSYALLHAWRSFERAAEVPVCDVHPAVERAARLIRDSSTALCLDELAHHAGLSAARLSRLFKEQTGFAMVDFRNRLRIQRYLEIYRTGQRLTILDSALEAGFGSYAQFHRVFKNVLGCSPAEYRYAKAYQICVTRPFVILVPGGGANPHEVALGGFMSLFFAVLQ